MSDFYQIECIVESGVAMIDTPMNPKSEPLVSLKPLSSGAYSSSLIFPECRECCDLVPCLTGEFTVSSRACDAIRSFTYSSDTTVIPVKVGSLDITAYCFHFLTEFCILDEAATEFEYGRGKASHIKLSTVKPILVRAEIPDYDLIRVQYVPGFVCSQRFKDKITSLELTNFSFTKLGLS